MRLKKIFSIILLVIVIIATLCSLYFFGVLQINNPNKNKYPVKGVDVSSYQGDINWDILSKQGIYFAYIKATEGSSHVDSKFAYNFNNAFKTDLKVGAYHFFSFDSSGIDQANHYIKNVPKTKGMLPPVVDLEYYFAYPNSSYITAEKQSYINKNLDEMLTTLEEHYGTRPIIYVTEESYDLFIKNNSYDYPIWVRSVYGKPKFIAETDWLLWQYSNRKVLKGYNGDERYIDMNVFNGSAEDFDKISKVN